MSRLPMRVGGISIVALVAMAGCTTTPERIDELEQARSTVQSLERQPMARTAAATQLTNARSALARAEKAQENREPMPEIRHEATVARLNAELGLERIAEEEALQRIEQAKAERTQVQLEARTAAAERAQKHAEAQTAEARQMKRQATSSRKAAQSASAQATRLQQELSELQAKQSERGIVLTLGDVLFETDKAELKPGAARAIERLATFMKDYPDRRLLIEGHTDSRGSEEYNEELSRRRAYAVTEALVQRGIESNRLHPVGAGESYPVASNDSAAGRQQNRRVEVVVSDKDGSFPDAAERVVHR